MYKGKKVLIVDDSPVERYILKGYLTKLGFEIFEAENGESGVKSALEIHPDVILMDVLMDGINGFQATKQITLNENLKNVKVIMCTAKDKDTDKMWGTRQGASAYITKPIVESILISEITKLIG